MVAKMLFSQGKIRLDCCFYLVHEVCQHMLPEAMLWVEGQRPGTRHGGSVGVIPKWLDMVYVSQAQVRVKAYIT